MVEPRFKPGDKVFHASIRGGQFSTIKKVNERFRVAVVDFGKSEVSVSINEDLYPASEIDRSAPPLSLYEKMLMEQSEIFKPGVSVMESRFGYGTVVEVLPSGKACVDFKFYGQQDIDTRSFNVRLATEEDKNWQPRQPKPEPEPMCEPEDVTLEHLESEVSDWEQFVCSIEAVDCTDEYTHDLLNRELLHGLLNGFAMHNLAVPDVLKARIDVADKRFVELTRELDSDVWNSGRTYDKSIFWYYYRWPVK